MSSTKISLIPDNAITEIGKKVYDDVAHPVFSEVGLSAQGILKFVALPFKFLGLTAEQLEAKYKNFIQSTINKVPSEKITSPSSNYLVSTILDSVKYTFDEVNLYEMYSRLLANSINRDNSKVVHPTQIEILKQFTPQDAQIFKDCFYSDISVMFYFLSVKLESKWEQYTYIFDLRNETFTEYPYNEYDIKNTIDVLTVLNVLGENDYYEEEFLTKLARKAIDTLQIKYPVEKPLDFAGDTTVIALSDIGKKFKRVCLNNESMKEQ